MHDLFRMDLYRMRKSRGFRALLIISFALAFVMPLIRRGFIWLVEITGDDPTPIDMLFGANPKLSWIIGNPFSSINALLMFLSAFVFFGADTSRGYIKNTIGLVPGRDRVIITRFLVIMVHNTLFMIAGVIGCLFGTMIFKQPVDQHMLCALAAGRERHLIVVTGITSEGWNNTEGQCLAYVKAQPAWDLLGCGEQNNMLIHLDGHAILRSDMECILDYCDAHLTGAPRENASRNTCRMKGALFLEENREALDPLFGL